jgi:hypothetical protein
MMPGLVLRAAGHLDAPDGDDSGPAPDQGEGAGPARVFLGFDIEAGRHVAERSNDAIDARVRAAETAHVFKVPLEGSGAVPYQYHVSYKIPEKGNKQIKKAVSSVTKMSRKPSGQDARDRGAKRGQMKIS